MQTVYKCRVVSLDLYQLLNSLCTQAVPQLAMDKARRRKISSRRRRGYCQRKQFDADHLAMPQRQTASIAVIAVQYSIRHLDRTSAIP
jgi:hypothetical protein